MRPKGGGHREKFGRWSFSAWDPCNPLKSHKTTQSFLWKSLQKTGRDLEKLGEKAWRPPLFRRLRSTRGVGLSREAAADSPYPCPIGSAASAASSSSPAVIAAPRHSTSPAPQPFTQSQGNMRSRTSQATGDQRLSGQPAALANAASEPYHISAASKRPLPALRRKSRAPIAAARSVK